MGNSMTAEAIAASVKAIPVGRMGKADELAATVDFLASDASGYITGAVIDINGGTFIP